MGNDFFTNFFRIQDLDDLLRNLRITAEDFQFGLEFRANSACSLENENYNKKDYESKNFFILIILLYNKLKNHFFFFFSIKLDYKNLVLKLKKKENFDKEIDLKLLFLVELVKKHIFSDINKMKIKFDPEVVKEFDQIFMKTNSNKINEIMAEIFINLDKKNIETLEREEKIKKKDIKNNKPLNDQQKTKGDIKETKEKNKKRNENESKSPTSPSTTTKFYRFRRKNEEKANDKDEKKDNNNDISMDTEKNENDKHTFNEDENFEHLPNILRVIGKQLSDSNFDFEDEDFKFPYGLSQKILKMRIETEIHLNQVYKKKLKNIHRIHEIFDVFSFFTLIGKLFWKKIVESKKDIKINCKACKFAMEFMNMKKFYIEIISIWEKALVCSVDILLDQLKLSTLPQETIKETIEYKSLIDLEEYRNNLISNGCLLMTKFLIFMALEDIIVFDATILDASENIFEAFNLFTLISWLHLQKEKGIISDKEPTAKIKINHWEQEKNKNFGQCIGPKLMLQISSIEEDYFNSLKV